MIDYNVFDDDKLIIHRHTTTISNDGGSTRSYVFKTLRIVRVTDGIADWKIGSAVYTVEKDDIIILNNIEVRQFYPYKDKTVTIDIYEFLPSSFYYNNECQNIFYNRGDNFRNVIRHQSLLESLAKLDYEIINQPPLHKSMISGLLISFLLTAARLMGDSVILTDNTNSSEYAAVIARAASYINNNLTADLNVNALAKISNMSGGYFSKMFKKYTRFGVVDYINMCRINNVNRILANSDCTITEAAFNSGYKTTSNFYRAVKKYGLSLQR
jgi:AraC-type DNA-binding domain-containing proteins